MGKIAQIYKISAKITKTSWKKNMLILVIPRTPNQTQNNLNRLQNAPARPKMVPKMLQNGLNQNAPTGPKMAPKVAPDGAKVVLNGPKLAPNGLKMTPDAPRWTPMAPRWSPMPSGSFKLRPASPEALQKPSRPRFWTLKTSILHSPDVDLAGPTEPIMIPKN